MISDGINIDLNSILQIIANKLDLDPTRYEKADKSYHAVGEWLNDENSPLQQYKPEIFPQGSFMLGTIVKPLEGDFDLDFVCLLENGAGLSSHETFHMIGDRLKTNATYASMLEPKNRCWRLEYAGDFHLDVIPAIPDMERGNTSILVPDRAYSDQVIPDWTKSDPKEYFEWFSERMKVQYDLQLQAIARKFQKEIEEIPDYLIKTELQLAIQLLKRHRDLIFQGDREKDKPISIIITTLAGHICGEQGYQGDLFSTLKLLAEFMSQRVNPSIPRVPNPTNNEEDFADKWEAKPERKQAFHEWVTKLRSDLDEIGRCSSVSDCEEKLKKMFGENVMKASLTELSLGSSILAFQGDRFDVAQREDPGKKWTMDISSSNGVHVSGYIKHNELRSEEFFSDCPQLDKNLNIYFIAKTTNINQPYKVYWQIVNTGHDAAAVENRRGLRGGFDESSSPYAERRNEMTQYKGMHWIEAFIIKGNQCVARSGEFVVNIK